MYTPKTFGGHLSGSISPISHVVVFYVKLRRNFLVKSPTDSLFTPNFQTKVFWPA